MADTGITVRTDVVIPEVISGLVVTDALITETPLLRSPYVLDVARDVYYRDGGDHVKFLARKFMDGVTTPKDMVQNMVRTSKTGVDGKKVKLEAYSENIVDRVVSIEYDEYTVEDAARQGSLEQFFAQLIAEAMSEELHAALLTKAAETTLEYDLTALVTKTVTVDSILSAKMLWGEKATGKRPGLYLHSKQWTDLAKTSDFKTLGTAATTALVTAQEQANGAVAVVHGVTIYVCDTVTVTSGTPDTYTGIMLMPGALGLLIKDVKARPPHRFPGTSVFQLDTDMRYTDTLFRHNPRPAIKFKSQ